MMIDRCTHRKLARRFPFPQFRQLRSPALEKMFPSQLGSAHADRWLFRAVSRSGRLRPFRSGSLVQPSRPRPPGVCEGGVWTRAAPIWIGVEKRRYEHLGTVLGSAASLPREQCPTQRRRGYRPSSEALVEQLWHRTS
eukprot:scaffold71_cov247-Pinguiococcus_pyrenoidosus.AAC.45